MPKTATKPTETPSSWQFPDPPMVCCLAELEGISPLSQSRFHDEPKLDRETDHEREERTWKLHAHFDPNSREVYIPPKALHNALAAVAKYLSIQIPGKGKQTFTKHVEGGIWLSDPIYLGQSVDEIDHEWLLVSSTGKRGSEGPRVKRCYPLIQPGWKGTARIYVLDPVINAAVLRHFLTQAGKFIGIGRFRPQNLGFYGRFKVNSFEWDVE